MSKYRVVSLPPGVVLDGCTVARSSDRNGRIFVKTKEGAIFIASSAYRDIDFLAEFGSNARDRSVFAKLAGITVKEIDAARKLARDRDLKEQRVFALRRLKRDAEKLGMKVTKVRA